MASLSVHAADVIDITSAASDESKDTEKQSEDGGEQNGETTTLPTRKVTSGLVNRAMELRAMSMALTAKRSDPRESEWEGPRNGKRTKGRTTEMLVDTYQLQPKGWLTFAFNRPIPLSVGVFIRVQMSQNHVWSYKQRGGWMCPVYICLYNNATGSQT